MSSITSTICYLLITFALSQLLLSIRRHMQCNRWDVQRFPSVTAVTKAHWLWGHELVIFEHQASEMYSKWLHALGPMYRLKAALFQPDILVACDNAAAQHIFQNLHTYVKAPAFRPLSEKLVGRGIVWAQGDDHKHQRRLVAPAFTSAAVNGMADTIFTCTDKMIQILRASLSTQRNTAGVLNIVPFMSSCTLDIIGQVAFGYDFRADSSTEAQEIISAWRQDVLLGRTFAAVIGPILLNLFPWIARLPIPALQTDGVAKRIALQLGSMLLEQNRSNGTQDVNANGVGGRVRKDMMSLLVEDHAKKGKGEARLSDDQLLQNIATFIIVGQETTASTANFTVFELARHPLVQKKLRQEIRDAGDHLDHDSINKLVYLDAVIKEGLRLHAASPYTERVVLHDDVIPLRVPVHTENKEVLTSICIKAGQIIRIPFTSLNRDARVWGADASQFKPERWIEPDGVPTSSEMPSLGPWVGISTFCDGPRSCIGWRLAVLELKVIIATLVRSFEFESTDVETKQYTTPTLQPESDGVMSLLPVKVSIVVD